MVQPGLSKAIGTILRHVPLSMWPALVSRRTGVLTPRAMAPLASPAASGGANVRILLDFLDPTQAGQGAVAECGVWRGGTPTRRAPFFSATRSKNDPPRG